MQVISLSSYLFSAGYMCNLKSTLHLKNDPFDNLGLTCFFEDTVVSQFLEMVLMECIPF